jgi:hypothetical protein
MPGNLPAEQGRAPHSVHLWAVRVAPYFLMMLGLFMVLAGALAHHSDAVAVALITLGAFLAVAGAVISRVAGDLKVGTTGVVAGLDSLRSFDPKRDFVLTGPPTMQEILDTALRSGWTESRTLARHALLTKLIREPSGPFAAGDTVSVTLPTSDLDQQVSRHLLETLAAAGFPGLPKQDAEH